MHYWLKLLNAPNTTDLALLASRAGRSRRHLIAQFHSHFGMTPKTIARIRRFNVATGKIAHPTGKPYLDLARDSELAPKMDASWVDLALRCGYYDQSHFIKEFRAFAGVTPVEFLCRMHQ